MRSLIKGAECDRSALSTDQIFGPFLSALLRILIFVGLLSIGAPSRAFAATELENLVDPTQAADNSFIYDTTVGSLYSQASLYDVRTVQVAGEVIGDRIRATSNSCWITLTETVATDKSSISVLMSNDLADQIDHYGRYGVRGSTMQVRGIYHQACDEHDGLPDIHATTASVLTRGSDTPDTVNAGELVTGFVLIVIGIILMSAFYIARERTR